MGYPKIRFIRFILIFSFNHKCGISMHIQFSYTPISRPSLPRIGFRMFSGKTTGTPNELGVKTLLSCRCFSWNRSIDRCALLVDRNFMTTSKSSWEVLHQADIIWYMFLELDNWTKLDQALVPMTCFSDIHTQGGAPPIVFVAPPQLCQNIYTNPSETVVDKQGHHLAYIFILHMMQLCQLLGTTGHCTAGLTWPWASN